MIQVDYLLFTINNQKNLRDCIFIGIIFVPSYNNYTIHGPEYSTRYNYSIE